MHNLVVLVVTIPTSPRLSETELVDESYCVFGSVDFSKQKIKKKKKWAKQPARPGLWPAHDRGLSVSWPAIMAGPGQPWPAHPIFPIWPSRPFPRPGRPDGRPFTFLPPTGRFLPSLLSGLLPHLVSNFWLPFELFFPPLLPSLLSFRSLNPSNTSCFFLREKREEV